MNLYRLAILLVLLSFVSQAQTFTNLGPSDMYYATDLYAGVNGKFFAGTTGGLYESTDGGKTWARPRDFRSTIYLEPKFASGASPTDVYVYDRNYLYYSADNGEHWRSQYVFWPLVSKDIQVVAATADTLYFGTPEGVYCAPTGKDEYVPALLLPDQNILTLWTNGKNIVAGTQGNGVFISQNGGKAWQHHTAGLPTTDVTAIASNGDVVFLGFRWSGGVYVSNDWSTWTPKNTGLIFPSILDLQVDGNSLYALTESYDNVYVSGLDGSAWTLRPRLTGRELPVAFAVAGDNIVVGCWRAMYHSGDRGNTWISSLEGIQDTFVFRSIQAASDGSLWAVASHTGIYKKKTSDKKFTPFQNETNYASATLIGDTLPVVAGVNIKMYNVVHDTWGRQIPIDNKIFFPMNLEYVNGEFLLGSLTTGVHRYRGSKWSAINEGLGDLNLNSFNVHQNVMYVGTAQGAFKRGLDDAGWTKINFSPDNSGAHRILAADSLILIHGTDYNSYISNDHGVTWSRIEALDGVAVLDALLYHDNHLYAASYSRLWISADKGHTWKVVPIGDYFVDAMNIYNDTLYLGLTENGIWSVPLNDILDEPGEELPTAISAERDRYTVFPNPGHGEYFIKGLNDRPADVTHLVVTDILGCRIDVAVTPEANDVWRMRFPSNAPRGQYILSTGRGSERRVTKIVRE